MKFPVFTWLIPGVSGMGWIDRPNDQEQTGSLGSILGIAFENVCAIYGPFLLLPAA